MTASIRVIVIAVVQHPRTGALLVDESHDPAKDETFHRPCGGGVEFGERARDALTREFAEEFDASIEVGRCLGVIENLFTFDGEQGHEIVIVHQASVLDPGFYDRDRFDVLDAEGEYAVWRPPATAHGDVPLYPEGLPDLLVAS